MAWARVDDGWWSHPKVLGLSLESRGLWITALSWSCAQRKSRVPTHLVRMVGASEAQVDELVDAGLWRPIEGGWEIHDWAEYQDLSLSEKRARAGRKGAESRWQNDGKNVLPSVDMTKTGMANDMANDGKGMAKTTPDQGKQDGKDFAKDVAIDGKRHSRYPSRPDPSHPNPSGSGSDLAVSHGSSLEVSSRNPWYDAVVAALDMPPRGNHEGLFGRIAAKAKAQGHPPVEILNRAALHLATFDFPLTPGSLHKRWDELGSKVVTATKSEKRRVQSELERMRRRQEIIGEETA